MAIINKFFKPKKNFGLHKDEKIGVMLLSYADGATVHCGDLVYYKQGEDPYEYRFRIFYPPERADRRTTWFSSKEHIQPLETPISALERAIYDIPDDYRDRK